MIFYPRAALIVAEFALTWLAWRAVMAAIEVVESPKTARFFRTFS